MKTATFEQILETVQKTNILPFISTCNIKCEFCSHKNNPIDIDVYSVPKLANEQVEQLIEYLSPDRKIVIGESASRIVEGEPFLYKDIMYMLKLIRTKYEVTTIQITSNGSFFTEDIIKELSKLEPIEINISLNSSSPEIRKNLIKDMNPQVAIKSCEFLKKYNIKYNGSLVAMPHITGWDDIKSTILYLCENNVELVRVFIPGYTKYSKHKLDFDELYTKTLEIINEIRKLYNTPIVVEPPVVRDLHAEIEGVIADSPSYASGLKQGDIILEVNNKSVNCRVEAFNLALKLKNPNIKYIRDNKITETVIVKSKNTSPGFVVSYDINPDILNSLERVILKNKSRYPLIISSELGYNPLRLLIGNNLPNVKILTVPSLYFGGSIKVNGLLTVYDIKLAISTYLEHNKCDMIILPSNPFDDKGYDLNKAHYLDIEGSCGIKVELI